MSDTLIEMWNKFGSTKPVFKGTLSSDLVDISFEPIESYDPRSVDLNADDPVAQLMIDKYHEAFDIHKKCFVVSNNMIDAVASTMESQLKKAFINASPLRNPQQSKLYKWFSCSTMNTSAKREGLIALYRYVRNNTDKNFRFDNGSDNPHAQNLVAIVEKMRDKYEQR